MPMRSVVSKSVVMKADPYDTLPSDCNIEMASSDPYPEYTHRSVRGPGTIGRYQKKQEPLTPQKVQAILKDVGKIFGINAPAPNMTSRK